MRRLCGVLILGLSVSAGYCCRRRLAHSRGLSGEDEVGAAANVMSQRRSRAVSWLMQLPPRRSSRRLRRRREVLGCAEEGRCGEACGAGEDGFCRRGGGSGQRRCDGGADGRGQRHGELQAVPRAVPRRRPAGRLQNQGHLARIRSTDCRDGACVVLRRSAPSWKTCSIIAGVNFPVFVF